MNKINAYSGVEPSFQANLKVRIPLKNASKERIENISKLFSEETKDYPKANLYISKSPSTSIVAGEPTYHLSENIDLGEYPISCVEPYLDPMLAKYDDKTVAQKLGKIFRCLKIETKQDMIERGLTDQALKARALVNKFTFTAKNYANKGITKFENIYLTIAERNKQKYMEISKEIDKSNDNAIKSMQKIIGKDEDLQVIPDSLKQVDRYMDMA